MSMILGKRGIAINPKRIRQVAECDIQNTARKYVTEIIGAKRILFVTLTPLRRFRR